MDRAVSCSATMIGVRYTARELWEFAKGTHAACCFGDGTCANLTGEQCAAAGGAWQGPGGNPCGAPNPCEGNPPSAVSESTAFLTQFCGLLLAVKPDLENAALPLYFRMPLAGKGSLDVVFTRRAAFLGRLLMSKCELSEEDIPEDMKIPQEPLGTAGPGGDRDIEADVETYTRRVDFIRQFQQGNECCPDPEDQAAGLPDMSCDELDTIVESIRTSAVDDDESVLEMVEALLRNRLHEPFQREEIVRALNETALSVESKQRIGAALEAGEAFSNEANLIRLQLEQQGLLERPAEEDAAAADAAAIIREIDMNARLLGGEGLPRVGPAAQIAFSTLYKWSHEACCLADGSCMEISHTPTQSPRPGECDRAGGVSCGEGSGCDPDPCPDCVPPVSSPLFGPKAPKTIGPEF